MATQKFTSFSVLLKHDDMTFVTIQPNKIVSNEDKENSTIRVILWGKYE